MEFTSYLIDRKIMGVNVGAELSVGEYLSFAREIIDKNQYQRAEIKSSARPYSLLRRDLIEGCVIPPIILAVTDHYGKALSDKVREAVRDDVKENVKRDLSNFIQRAAADRELLILDGLQRTLTLRAIEDSSDGHLSASAKQSFAQRPLRVEFYLGLSKPGILYRMLTLNTGQTPMSFRHQLEILYSDYIENKDLPDGIEIFREVDEKKARGFGKYKYSDVVDMFYAYSTGTPMPHDRQALVAELQELNFLEGFRYSDNADEMLLLLKMFNDFVKTVSDASNGWTYSLERTPDVQRPFGTNATSLIAKAQFMAGFAAECKRLIDKGVYQNVDHIASTISKLHFSGEPGPSLDQAIVILDQIARRAKKIGDAQRYYFQFVTRALFSPDGGTAFDLSQVWLRAQETYGLMYD